MADFTALNFTQILTPAGGGAPNAGGGQGGLLSGNVAADSGLLNGTPVAPGNNAVLDIFTLLLGSNNTLPIQENFTGLGKNLPAQGGDVSKPAEKTADSSLDALQSALTALLVQQSAPAPIQANVLSGQQGEDVVIGGAKQFATASVQLLGAADNAITAVQSDDLLGGVALSQPLPQNVFVNDDAALTTPVSPVQQGKTLDAYRSAAALVLPEVGSTLDTDDINAAKNIAASLLQPVEQQVENDESVAPEGKVVSNPLNVNNSSAETVVESVGVLKDIPVAAPLPQVGKKSDTGTGLAAEIEKPLQQLASLQSALASVKVDASKTTEKKEPTALQNNVSNTPASHLAPQSQQQNASQQLGDKKSGVDNVEALKPVSEKTEAENVQASPLAAQKIEVTKTPALDFANHLNKAGLSAADQVGLKIAQLPSGKQNITVQLDPAQLGKVDIKVEWNTDGRAQISIAAEHKETLDMLRSDMGALQRSLSDSGIKTDASNLQFSLRGQDGFAGQLAQGNQQKGGDNNNGQQASDVDLKQAVESASVAARYINLNNLLDLHV